MADRDEISNLGATKERAAASKVLDGEENQPLTPAQIDYLADMRASVEQMKSGDVSPLGELLDELRDERNANDQAHLGDQEI